MNRFYFLIVTLLLFIFPGCKAPVAELESPSKITASIDTREGTEKAALSWEIKWDDTLAKAKKEGIVDIYANWAADIRAAVIQAFKSKYGIELRFTAFGRGSELYTKLKAEKRAGLHIADVFGEADLINQRAIISLRRLRQEFYSLPEDENLLKERVL